MKLDEIVGKREINAAELARRTDYNATYVQGILRGRFKPGKKFLKILETLTLEDIKRDGFCNDRLPTLRRY